MRNVVKDLYIYFVMLIIRQLCAEEMFRDHMVSCILDMVKEVVYYLICKSLKRHSKLVKHYCLLYKVGNIYCIYFSALLLTTYAASHFAKI